MRIIITGACGHIGSFVSSKIDQVKKLKELILIDNFSSQRYFSIFNIRNKVKTKFYEIDVSKKDSLNMFKKTDYLIHCASYTNAEGSFNIKKEMFKNNLDCMRNVINYCKKFNSKLIHISSTSVYGKQVKIVNEDNDYFLKPQSPYAEIKLLEEKMLKKNNNKLKYMSFRFGTIAGVSKGMRFHTAVNKFCLNAALNQNIQIYKTAYDQYRPYLSLKDAFKVFKFCIEKNSFENSTYNALSGNYTVRQIINFIKKYKKNLKIKFVKSKIMNQLSYFVDDSKIKKLGLNLKSDIKLDIKETLKIFNHLKK